MVVRRALAALVDRQDAGGAPRPMRARQGREGEALQNHHANEKPTDPPHELSPQPFASAPRPSPVKQALTAPGNLIVTGVFARAPPRLSAAAVGARLFLKNISILIIARAGSAAVAARAQVIFREKIIVAEFEIVAGCCNKDTVQTGARATSRRRRLAWAENESSGVACVFSASRISPTWPR